MRLELALVFSLIAAGSVFAETAAEEPQENPELEREIAYVEALVDSGYPDLAAPVIEATKKRWPEADVRFFAIEIRSLLALNKFEEAEKKIGALPDRNGTKYWAARLEFANRYNFVGKKDECKKIYDEFFKKFASPKKELRVFYINACFAWGQILCGDQRFADAVKVYEGLLNLKPELETQQWCMMGCETVELQLKLASEVADQKKRAPYLDSAEKIVDKILKHPEQSVYFGRAVNMKSHIELLRGRLDRAMGYLEDYLPQLGELHESIAAIDPDGRKGMLRLSPMPQCRYLLARLMWDEALAESKKPKKDDEKIKSLMFGEKLANGKRNGQGAYNHSLNVFLRYPESTWAASAGELADEIKAFAEKTYGAKITSQVTPEMIAKVRAMQFKVASDRFSEGDFEGAIKEGYDVLSRYPECPESIGGIENLIYAHLEQILKFKLAKKGGERLEELRADADVIEGYLSERFAGAKRLMMLAAGDALLRVAAREKDLQEMARCDRLRKAFVVNYRKHATAAQTAAGLAGEAQREKRYDDAIALWKLVGEYYSNSVYYATSFAQLSECYNKLGERAEAIAAMNRYVELETNPRHRIQAQMSLAQLYKDDGLDILAAASTNETAEAIEAAEKRGTAQIIRAVKQFNDFSGKAAEMAKDVSLSQEEAKKFVELAEGAKFLAGECWSRMNRPESKIEMYRKQAAKSFEEYLETYPDGKYSKLGYVKLGTIYTALGDVEKSKNALDALSKRFPDSDEAKNAKPRLAKNLIEIGMKKEGAEIYAEMLGTDGAYSALQYENAGEALIDARNWELAGRAFDKAIKLAGTNQLSVVARARLGQAKSAFKQGSLAEAREALDKFLGDKKMAKMMIAADANFLLVEVASAQGRSEKDAVQRGKYFGAAIGAIKKVRQYWKTREQWEQDKIDLLSGDVLIDRMKAEEAMNLKEEAMETCGRAASTFQAFIQSHGASEERPLSAMSAGELENLERAYATIVPLFAKMGAEQAERVLRFGGEYLEQFPNGKARTEIANCMNRAKAELPGAALPKKENP